MKNILPQHAYNTLKNWMTTKEEIMYILEYLVDIKHYPILNRRQIMNLRIMDEIEIKAGQITEWQMGENGIYK